jgi:MFS family permease
MLLKDRRFLPLFVTQFASALEDNIYKNALVMMILFVLAQDPNAALLVTAATGVFILPYVLLSPFAGQVADRHDKAFILKMVSLGKLICFLIASIAIFFEHVPTLLFLLFVIGIGSAFFSPCKYSILPDHLPPEKLVKANGLLSMGTFLAIISGTVLGGLTITTQDGKWLTVITMCAVALIGLIAASYIPPASPKATTAAPYRPLRGFYDMLKLILTNPHLRPSVLGIAWFWFMGAVFLAQFANMAKFLLNADEEVITFFLVTFSVGIALGSLLSAKIQKNEITLRFVMPFGLCLGIFTLILSLYLKQMPIAPEMMNFISFITKPNYAFLSVLLFLIALTGGLYYVPMYAFSQHHAKAETRAQVMAGLGFMNSLFMVISSLLSGYLIKAYTWDAADLFMGMALLHLFIVLPLLYFAIRHITLKERT